MTLASELDLPKMLTRERHRVHLIGVAGSGMSGIAALLLELGHDVSGSDKVKSWEVDRLQRLGLRFRAEHRAEDAQDAELVTIGGHTLTSALVAGTGAIEITVHGWDVARACGRTDPVPPALADELLDLAPLLVACTDRPGRFDRPVPVPPGAAPGDRLVAFLGRQP